jgi:CRP-like cAMP-binding protein
MTELVIDFKAIARRLLRLEGLPLTGTDALAELLQTARPRQLDVGERLVSEGDVARDLLIVARGAVRVQLKDVSGKPAQVAILRAPFMLGHIAIVDDGKRSATCEMAADGLVLALSRQRVQAILTSTDRGAEVMRDLMLAGMFRQLDRATDRLRAFLRENPEVRVELVDEEKR